MNEQLLLDAEFWLLGNAWFFELDTDMLTAIYQDWQEPGENWFHLDDETCSWLALLIREAEFPEEIHG